MSTKVDKTIISEHAKVSTKVDKPTKRTHEVSTKVDKPTKRTREVSAKVDKPTKRTREVSAKVDKTITRKRPQKWTRQSSEHAKCPLKWTIFRKIYLYVYTKIFGIDLFFHLIKPINNKYPCQVVLEQRAAAP